MLTSGISNFVPLISKLPNDILYEVFILLSRDWIITDNDDSIVNYANRHSVLLVCRRWRDLILTSSRYWTFIRVDRRSCRSVQTYVQRSGSASLHILFAKSSSGPQQSDIDPIIAAAGILSTHSWRIESFCVTQTLLRRYRDILAQFKLPAPRLRTLRIGPVPSVMRDIMPMEVPFAGDFPLLQTLDTSDLFVRWNPCSRLTTLSFDFRVEDIMPIRRLMAVLRRCTYLRFLNLGCSINEEPSGIDEDHVRLPHLQEISLNTTYDCGVVQFLSLLSFPSSSRVHLRGYGCHAKLTEAGDWFRERLTRCKEVQVLTSPMQLTLVVGSKLVVEWPFFSEEGSAFTPLNFAPVASLESLVTIVSDPWETDLMIWRNNLSAAPSLKSLSVQCRRSPIPFYTQLFEVLWEHFSTGCLTISYFGIGCIQHDDTGVVLKEISDRLLDRQTTQAGGIGIRRLEICVQFTSEGFMQSSNLGFDRLEDCDVVIRKCKCNDDDFVVYGYPFLYASNLRIR